MIDTYFRVSAVVLLGFRENKMYKIEKGDLMAYYLEKRLLKTSKILKY